MITNNMVARLPQATNMHGWSGWVGGMLFGTRGLQGEALSSALEEEAKLHGRCVAVVNDKGSLEGWIPPTPPGYKTLSPARPFYIECDQELEAHRLLTRGAHGHVDPHTVARIRNEAPVLPSKPDIELQRLDMDSVPHDMRSRGRQRQIYAMPHLPTKEISDALYLLALDHPNVECVVLDPTGNVEGWVFQPTTEMINPVFQLCPAAKDTLPTFTRQAPASPENSADHE